MFTRSIIALEPKHKTMTHHIIISLLSYLQGDNPLMTMEPILDFVSHLSSSLVIRAHQRAAPPAATLDHPGMTPPISGPP